MADPRDVLARVLPALQQQLEVIERWAALRSDAEDEPAGGEEVAGGEPGREAAWRRIQRSDRIEVEPAVQAVRGPEMAAGAEQGRGSSPPMGKPAAQTAEHGRSAAGRVGEMAGGSPLFRGRLPARNRASAVRPVGGGGADVPSAGNGPIEPPRELQPPRALQPAEVHHGGTEDTEGEKHSPWSPWLRGEPSAPRAFDPRRAEEQATRFRGQSSEAPERRVAVPLPARISDARTSRLGEARTELRAPDGRWMDRVQPDLSGLSSSAAVLQPAPTETLADLEERLADVLERAAAEAGVDLS